jgi:plastocyanin
MTPAVPRTRRIPRSLTLAAALLGAALAAAACAPANKPPDVPVASRGPLVTEVVASTFDVGRMPAAAVAKDGTPSVSYLLLKPKLQAGQLPPAPVANTAQPPAVVVATFPSQQGYWSRLSASPQDYTNLKGLQSSIANHAGQFLPGVSTGIAVDGQGFHHVIWSTPDAGLLYTDDTQGNPPTYAAPAQITKDGVVGGAIAAAPDGTLWVSYYDGSDVDVASSPDGKTWTIQTVATAGNCSSCLPVRTAIAIGQSGPVVAYSDGGLTARVAVQASTLPSPSSGASGGWTVSDVDRVGNGFGISLAVVSDGTMYLAYYDSSGRVHLAYGRPGGYTTQEIGGSAIPSGADVSGFTTGVGRDGSGKVYATWTDPASGHVEFASGPPGSLHTVTVPQSAGGRNPALAISQDGKSLVLPFYDSLNQILDVAVPTGSGAALAAPSPTPSPPPAANAPPACSPQAGVTTLSITAQNTAFDTSCLAMTPNTGFTIDFTNNDAGTQHNVAIYTNAAATQLLGGAKSSSDTITGPASATYTVAALTAGIYFFRCDVHPTQMTGTFVVAKAGPQPGPSSSP